MMWDQHNGDAFKELPYYSNIVRSFLQKQIQYLLEQMAEESGEESVIMTVNLKTGTMSHLGSKAGKAFLDDRDDLKTQFMSYCITNYNADIQRYPTVESNTVFTGIKRKQTCSSRVNPATKYRRKKTPAPKEEQFTDPSMGVKREPNENDSCPDTDARDDLRGHEVDFESAENYGFGVGNNSSEKDLPGQNNYSDHQRSDETDIETGTDCLNTFINEVTRGILNQKDNSVSQKTGKNSRTSSDNLVPFKERYNDEYQTSGLEEFPAAAKSMTVLMDDVTGSLVKTEPLSDDEAGNPTQQPAAHSNMYMSTDGLVSVTKRGDVLRQNKRPESNKPRQMLTIAEKFQILLDMESNPQLSHRQLALRHNTGRSTVGLIARNKDFYRQQYEIYAESPRKKFSTSAKYYTLNDMVWQWYSESRQNGLLMSGTMVKEKALELAKEISETEFKASNGWLQSWQSRYNVKSFRVTGESRMNAITVSDWTSHPPPYDGEDPEENNAVEPSEEN